MQDYKRTVSYIYAYEDNQKKNNTGFAKLEARGREGHLSCRINGKSGLTNEEILEVYFLHIGEYYEGIKVGTFKAINGQAALELRINTADIGGSGFELADMHGLFFRTKQQPYKVFASSWVDAPLRLDRFREYKKEELIETFFEALEKYGEQEEEDIEDNVNEGVKETDEGTEETDESTEETDEGVKETDVSTEEADVSAEELTECCPAEKCKSPWEKICCRYPKVIAFENNMSCMCLKVDIKDIEVIFGGSFNMASNTFAIKSYMRYKYLLLIENEKDSEGKSCILGAPGIFNNNDNRVACMCGFNEFRPSKNAEKMNCRFGYWLKEIKL